MTGLLIVVAAAAAVILWAMHAAGSSWHFRSCRACCAAAQACAKHRYLKDSAPTLPLESCDASRCQCAFAEHTDRWIGSHTDRRTGVGLQSELYGSRGEPERRRHRGRRAIDRFERSSEIIVGGSQ